ncbi:metallophosphoesterase family protein [Marinobacter halophilus]|uniref:Serine/threonine protein phosphatase n=1 Tax=Marinobacter halophilus TaxID=1323740 RepID=A0A2T1KBQ4_9GAMM|nr:metallophosphoesterase [Marinobacter halophilus]PSF07569.1 serine/threonine protein phosphatase [Marinobacter halophilus]
MRLFLLFLIVLGVAGCNDSSSEISDVAVETQDKRSDNTDNEPPVKAVSSLKVGLLPDTQGGGDNVSVHPMEAVLAKLADEGVNIVIPVGDLTDHGTTREFEQWIGIAEKYRDQGIEFLPLMGNHEDSYAYTVEWIENMKDYIPADAVHMSGAEYLDYYVVRDNVLIIALRYYHLPVAFQWIKGVVEQHRDEVDHVVIASHDGLIGAKYGEAREMIVEGIKNDDRLLHQWDDIRAFFSKHDVIWVQGHEHQYQRSVIKAPVGIEATSWIRDDRNYRLPQYTQIMSGNASYKGYEFRYGERELVQAIIQQKMNTMKNGSNAFDANAGLLTFTGQRIDYANWFAEHTVTSNEDGPRELESADWTLLDRFSRTTDRCERLIYPNSIPDSTRPVMVFNPGYRTNECFAADGSVAKLLDGFNNTFNRLESRTRSLGWTQGFSRAESQNDLIRLGYQYLFQFHQRWTPNLNGNNRLIPNMDDISEVYIPETTIDLKEHLTMSWAPAEKDTRSEVMIISGTQGQTGTFSSAYGAPKDIETDSGLPGSQPDGTAKTPVTLPPTATKSWDLEQAVSDTYVVQFDAPRGKNYERLNLGIKTAQGDWAPLTNSQCLVEGAYSSQYLQEPPVRNAGCSDAPLIGYDSNYEGRWWALMNQDAELALVVDD